MSQTFVVFNFNSNNLYLTAEITGVGGVSYQWGNPRDAIEYETLVIAEAKAADIGGGTAGTPKP